MHWQDAWTSTDKREQKKKNQWVALLVLVTGRKTNTNTIYILLITICSSNNNKTNEKKNTFRFHFVSQLPSSLSFSTFVIFWIIVDAASIRNISQRPMMRRQHHRVMAAPAPHQLYTVRKRMTAIHIICTDRIRKPKKKKNKRNNFLFVVELHTTSQK